MVAAPGETEPLLANTIRAVHAPRASTSKKLLVLGVCSVLILAVDFGFYMASAPQTAIFEEIICRNHGLQSRASNGTSGGVDPWQIGVSTGGIGPRFGLQRHIRCTAR